MKSGITEHYAQADPGGAQAVTLPVYLLHFVSWCHVVSISFVTSGFMMMNFYLVVF